MDRILRICTGAMNALFLTSTRTIVSSDTYGKIDIKYPLRLIDALILQLKDCAYITKTETVRGKTPSGYDDIRDYSISPENIEMDRW
jgi:hypothetical protein|nr:hypothetical protein [uncultured Oscillibacter sp.]